MKPITVTITTKKKDQVVDITETVETHLLNTPGTDGVCVVFAAHTTCAITTADLDPGTDQDLLNALRKLLPAIRYRHPHDPSHTPDHILATLIGPSVSAPVRAGRLVLGVWQRIVL